MILVEIKNKLYIMALEYFEKLILIDIKLDP